MLLTLSLPCGVQDPENIRAFLQDAEKHKTQFIIVMASEEPELCIVGLCSITDLDEECLLIMEGDEGEHRGLHGLFQQAAELVTPIWMFCAALTSV